jgi:anti-anti-sigma factor
VLILAGRLGSASAGGLSRALTEAISGGDRRLVVDLGLVDYVSSAGLDALGTAAIRCAGSHGALVLCNVSAPVRIVFDLAGLPPDILVEPSREQGVARALQEDVA